jgi:hypothetical protein
VSEPKVRAAHAWKSNAHLIEDVAKLGYLNGHVLDPTYGKGRWWKRWQPKRLTTSADVPLDFRRMPFPTDTFDAVVFDPPYVAPGGRETSTIKGMHADYGMDGTRPTPWETWDYNQAGFWECVRVVGDGGYVLYKSKDYVTSGHVQWVIDWIIGDTYDSNLDLVDRFEHVGRPGPQSQKEQVHARRNLSTLLVFRVPKHQ